MPRAHPDHANHLLAGWHDDDSDHDRGGSGDDDDGDDDDADVDDANLANHPLPGMMIMPCKLPMSYNL